MTKNLVGECRLMKGDGGAWAQEAMAQVDRRKRWQYQFKSGNVSQGTFCETKNGVGTCN